tara:strand:- start:81270 stop:82400 length:1131 start_codon:yes stop_codon:yes gene_type:complete
MPRTLKVLHLCQRDDPSTGGAVQVAGSLVKQFTHLDDVDARLLFLYGEPGAFYDRLGERCEYLKLRSSRDVPLYGVRLIRRLSSVDIVHHHDMLAWSNLASLVVPGLKRIMHGHVAAGVRNFGWRTKIANRIQTTHLDRFIAITRDVANSWADDGVSPSLITVVNNGIDMDQFSADEAARIALRREFGFGDSDIVMGFVGRLHNAMKGVDDFIKTLSYCHQRYKAIIVGEGPDRTSLTQLAAKLGVETRVRFAGGVIDPHRYYSAMDMFLFTSRFEHFGLAPLEAIAAGVPVFSFQCAGGFNEWASDDLMYRLDSRDCAQMARLIEETTQSGTARQTSIRAQSYVRARFDVSRMADQVADVYRQLTCGDQPAAPKE